MKDRLLASNPARGVKLPRKKPKPRAYLSDAQVWKLADEAGAKGVIVLLLAYTGLRWGELAGLHVADVDMLRRRISVHRNAVNVGGADRGGNSEDSCGAGGGVPQVPRRVARQCV